MMDLMQNVEKKTDGIYKVLIVDDEHLARTLLEEYVSKLPDLVLASSCSNAMSAMTVMRQQEIDILLTDIEMPELTGVEFVENLPYRPSIIFTTAYSQYAIDGYDLGVVDYLLKPIPFNRFVKAINKAVDRIKLIKAAESHISEGMRQEIASNATSQEVQPVTNTLSSMSMPREFMMLRADRRMYKVMFEDLLYMEGQQEYVTFHTKQRKITAYFSMKKLMEELPQGQFVRIHKSYIVSAKHVEIVDVASVTVAGVELPIGPAYRETALKELGV